MAEMMMENPAAAGGEGVLGEEEMVRPLCWFACLLGLSGVAAFYFIWSLAADFLGGRIG